MAMLTLLAACNGPGTVVVGPKDTDSPAVDDADGDGSGDSEDCDDDDTSVYPGAPETPEDGVDQDCDGWDPLAARTHTGALADEGFGTRVLLTSAGVRVGAPFHGATTSDGRVYTATATVEPTLEGAGGALAGAALAELADGTVLVGLPGVGRVQTLGGDVLLEQPGVGGVLAANATSWITSTPTGVLSVDGTRTDWDRRPDALALDEAGTVWAGFARGEVALRSGDTAILRASATDEAGFALLLADVGGDGKADLVVGAPGAGVVYVLDPAALPASLADVTPVGPGTGRFGAALAVGTDGVLYVGAPMAGAGVAGAVYAVKDGEVTERWSGAAAGDQLGYALAAGRASLVMGAPGAASSAGSVRIVNP